ncbi:hypothetical protein MRX96_032666 [Rhipicephalus microplus]
MAQSAPPATRAPRQCQRRVANETRRFLSSCCWNHGRSCHRCAAEPTCEYDGTITGSLQQVTPPESSLVPPMFSLDPSHCRLPAFTEDELMDSTNSRKRCRDDDGSDCDAPHNHAQPAPS